MVGLSSLLSEPPVEKKVPLTNLTKVFWPDEGYTKGDLIEYYRTISPWLLPYPKDRTTIRLPNDRGGRVYLD